MKGTLFLMTGDFWPRRRSELVHLQHHKMRCKHEFQGLAAWQALFLPNWDVNMGPERPHLLRRHCLSP